MGRISSTSTTQIFTVYIAHDLAGYLVGVYLFEFVAIQGFIVAVVATFSPLLNGCRQTVFRVGISVLSCLL